MIVDRAGVMILSVLMASLEDRADQRDRLAAHIRAQIPDGQAELLIDVNRGPCWRARQRLLEAAQGRYVCFVDDDDWVADDYIPALLAALADSPDFVGFTVAYTFDGRPMPNGYINAAYDGWSEDPKGYYRDFSHLAPVRRDLALKAGFSGDDEYEDRGYVGRLRSAGVASHTVIDRSLYHYQFRSGPKWWIK